MLTAEEVSQWPTPDESTAPATDPGRYREREHIERHHFGSASRDDTGKVTVKTEPRPGALRYSTSLAGRPILSGNTGWLPVSGLPSFVLLSENLGLRQRPSLRQTLRQAPQLMHSP